jgi:flagellar biosynthetic protein FliR
MAAIPWELGIAVFFLVLARLAPMVFATPFFGGRRVSATVRLVVSLALAAVMMPIAWPAGATAVFRPAHGVALLALKEGLIGLILALMVAIVFAAIEAAGRLIDLSRGAQMSQVLTGQNAEPTSPFGALLVLYAVVVFMAIGGHRMVLAALARTYSVVPLFGWPAQAAWGGIARLVIVLGQEFFLIAFGLAAPILAVNFLVEISIGLAGKLAPQMPAYFVGLPLKAWGGVLIVFLVLPWAVAWFHTVFTTGLQALTRAVGLLAQ